MPFNKTELLHKGNVIYLLLEYSVRTTAHHNSLCLSRVFQVEMSQDMDLVVPLMIANFIAKVVADMLAKPLYKYQLDAKALPYLDPELEVTIDGHV